MRKTHLSLAEGPGSVCFIRLGLSFASVMPQRFLYFAKELCASRWIHAREWIRAEEYSL